MTSGIVYTNKARCRDCYRCVRVCPVKAIRMTHGQASVVEERCLACGACIRECPQGAKAFRNDLGHATMLLASGERVAASVAPSFASVYREWEWRRLPSALRRLGFAYVGETSVGAMEVGRQGAEHVRCNPGRSHIATACPAVVRYVERYATHRFDDLVPTLSPMMAHARMMKNNRKAQRVVFIGPCVAKKAEAERPELAGIVDCVLTFAELNEWLEREGISLSHCEESSFDETAPAVARQFPLAGGQLKTGQMSSDTLAASTISVCGCEQIEEALRLAGSSELQLVEPLFCQHGCINGPGIRNDDNILERRMRVLAYARQGGGPEAAPAPSQVPDIGASFSKCPVPDDSRITDFAIEAIYERTGKLDPENRLNCGACGYATCRDKAIAVLRGMAEAEMCIPYMRYLAERRTDRIIDTSPNGIVILDGDLRIIGMNPAFRKLFMCSESVLGKPISYLMDPHPFEQLATGVATRLDFVAEHRNYNYVFHHLLYGLPEDNQYVGIFVDITQLRANEEELNRVRSETLAQARELLEHQLQAAQDMTRFLGENTARGERLVENLMTLVEGSAQANREKRQ